MLNRQHDDGFINRITNPIIGLFNKSSTDKTQKDVKICEQSEVEEKWIQEKVNMEDISSEDAKKLGLKALAQQLDGSSLMHLEPFLKKSKNDALELRDSLREEIQSLGVEPTKIDANCLKEDIKEKLAESRQEAESRLQNKIISLWTECACTNGQEPNAEKGLKIARDTFLRHGDGGGGGVDFQSEAEFIMMAQVRKPFDNDDKGPGMQIGRFEDLRMAYVNKSDVLVSEYSQSFQEQLERRLDFFEDLSSYLSGMYDCVRSETCCMRYCQPLVNPYSYLLRDLLDAANVDKIPENVTKWYISKVVEPLFANLHDKVCEEHAGIWEGDKLIEKHANKREELNKKLQVLQEVINGWEELLPEIEETAAPLAPPVARSPGRSKSGRRSLTPSGTPKRKGGEGGSEGTNKKLPRTQP